MKVKMVSNESVNEAIKWLLATKEYQMLPEVKNLIEEALIELEDETIQGG